MAEQQQPQRPNFSPRKDPLEMYDDRELIRRYRMDRAGILFVTDLIRDVMATSGIFFLYLIYFFPLPVPF